MRSIYDIARYIGLGLLSKGYSVSPLKLQKLLYYVQSWYMVFFGAEHTLFEEAPEAWVNGPVYPQIFHKYKACVSNMCDHLKPEHFDAQDVIDGLQELTSSLEFTDEEIRCIDSIITLYGAKSQNQLILMTHSESPWVEARGDLLPIERSSHVITHQSMYTYYNDRRQRRIAKQND
ncbi:MAG: DUF4065 domain-containing protein [Bacteroidaceae bacterium]|nr:DUF4065 domain-containing protein [Bacteroidaceae bacterium]MDE7166398.1 DUF4065 domain-containing protein [Bacteroidaceae bacterium]